MWQNPESQKYLLPLTSKPKRLEVIAYDIESKHEDTQKKGFTRPFLCGFYDGAHYHPFRNDRNNVGHLPWNERHYSEGGCIDRMMKALLVPEHNNKKVGIFAHNGGKFDHLFVMGWLNANKKTYAYDIVPIQSRILRFDVWKRGERKKCMWTFYDSVSLFPMSLDKLLTEFELAPKKKQNLNTCEDDPSWEEYHEQDCRGLHDALDKFTDMVEELGGEVGITAPATAMRLFRRAFFPSDLQIFRNMHFRDCVFSEEKATVRKRRAKRKVKRLANDGLHADIEEKEPVCHGCLHAWIRRAYYGGRTELFEREGQNLKYYDVNSSYPFSMLKDMPVGPAIELDADEHDKKWGRYIESCVGFIECTVYVPKTCKIPPIPHQLDGKLKFPTGTFSGVWCYEELKCLAHVGGEFFNVKRSVWFPKAKIFEPFVRKLYGYRKKHLPSCPGDGCKQCNPEYSQTLSAIAKLMLNSLYGKFGMRPLREKYIFLDPSDDDERPEDLFSMRKYVPADLREDPLTCKMWKVQEYTDAPYIIPQISATVTTYSRVLLWEHMHAIVKHGGRVCYCDTDSIITDSYLPTGNELGDMKDEYPDSPNLALEALRPKLYRLSTGVKKKPKHSPCSDPWCSLCKKVKHVMKGYPRPESDSENPEVAEAEKEKQSADAFMACLEAEGVLAASPKLKKRKAGKGSEDPLAQMSKRLMSFRSMVGGRRKTPEMVTSYKSLKSRYDKRVSAENGSTDAVDVAEKVVMVPRKKKR